MSGSDIPGHGDPNIVYASACPECRSEDVKQTLRGSILPGRDTNKATCRSCGWVGIAADFVTLARKRKPEDD